MYRRLILEAICDKKMKKIIIFMIMFFNKVNINHMVICFYVSGGWCMYNSFMTMLSYCYKTYKDD